MGVEGVAVEEEEEEVVAVVGEVAVEAVRTRNVTVCSR